MLKQGYKEVNIGKFCLPISEQNADDFQNEIEQIMIIMKLSEMDVRVDRGQKHMGTDGKKYIYSASIVGKGENVGFNITFTHKNNDVIVDVVGKIDWNDMLALREELKSQYGDCVKNRMGGITVINNEQAMIGLLNKIKYKL